MSIDNEIAELETKLNLLRAKKEEERSAGIEDANKQIASLVDEAKNLIQKAEAIADEFSLTFSWDLAYGMGGYYRGRDKDWDESTAHWNEESYGWQSSSQGC